MSYIVACCLAFFILGFENCPTLFLVAQFCRQLRRARFRLCFFWWLKNPGNKERIRPDDTGIYHETLVVISLYIYIYIHTVYYLQWHMPWTITDWIFALFLVNIVKTILKAHGKEIILACCFVQYCKVLKSEVPSIFGIPRYGIVILMNHSCHRSAHQPNEWELILDQIFPHQSDLICQCIYIYICLSTIVQPSQLLPKI